jgi:hypothetical protein
LFSFVFVILREDGNILSPFNSKTRNALIGVWGYRSQVSCNPAEDFLHSEAL